MRDEDTWLGVSMIAIVAVAVAIAVGANVSTLTSDTTSARQAFLSWFSGITAGVAFATLAFRR